MVSSGELSRKTGTVSGLGHATVRKILLICGVLASLLWIGSDILASLQYAGYSYTSQTVSELSAIGAPTRLLLIPLITAYEVLTAAFGLGILAKGSQKRLLRLTGILLIANAILAEVGGFFPMNLRGAEKTMTDVLHVVFGGGNVLFFLLSIGFGATAGGRGFRLYSLGTILVILFFGALTGMAGPQIAAGLPTPWLGIYERIVVYGYMLWAMSLAMVLVRAEKGPGPRR